MKRRLIFCLLAPCLALASKKTNSRSVPDALPGDWKFLYWSGGLGGFAAVYPPADSLYTISFRADGTFEERSSGRVTGAGTYQVIIIDSTSPDGNTYGLRLKPPRTPSTPPGYQGETLEIQMKQGEMILSEIYMDDGTADHYARTREPVTGSPFGGR